MKHFLIEEEDKRLAEKELKKPIQGFESEVLTGEKVRAIWQEYIMSSSFEFHRFLKRNGYLIIKIKK